MNRGNNMKVWEAPIINTIDFHDTASLRMYGGMMLLTTGIDDTPSGSIEPPLPDPDASVFR